jgi:hypothetical protein
MQTPANLRRLVGRYSLFLEVRKQHHREIREAINWCEELKTEADGG